MAVKAYTVEIARDRMGNGINGGLVVTWAPLANGDTGQPYACPHLADKSMQVRGTFGTGGNARIEGSNEQGYAPDGTVLAPVYATLNDPQGNALDITAAKVEQVLENTTLIRPNITAGDGTTSLTVVMSLGTPARSA